LVGFYLNENLAGGAIRDFTMHIKLLDSLKENSLETLMNYEKFQTDHSPFFFLCLNLIHLFIVKIKILFNYKENYDLYNVIRFLFLHISLIIPFIFYKCLKIKYNNCNSKILILLSCIFLISPYFRSYAIWPGETNFALLFLITSIFYSLKLEKLKINEDKKYLYLGLHILFYALAAYSRPIYSLISIYFFYKIYLKFNFGTEILFFIILNIILSFPAVYYVFGLDNVFFIAAAPANQYITYFINPTINLYCTNILLISSIFLFYSVPYISMNRKMILKKIFIFDNKKLYFLFFNFILTLILISNFSYSNEMFGGGFVYKVSNVIFNNNILFFIIAYFSIYFVLKIILGKNIQDLLLILILFCLDPDSFVYHKTYDPLIFCVLLLLINNPFFDKLTKDNQKIFALSMGIFYVGVFLMYIFIRTYLI